MARADLHLRNEQEYLELAAHSYPQDVQVIEVVLSERNLLSLLSKLYLEGSHRTIYNDDVTEGYILKVVAEDDKTHYGSRPVEPGLMVPETESVVAFLQKALHQYKREGTLKNLFDKGVKESREDKCTEKSQLEYDTTS